MDEAGYGPNLGPLVITATAWSVCAPLHQCSLWEQLDAAVTRSAAQGDDRLHVADSKQVYSTAKGLASLERSALCLLRLAGINARSLQGLIAELQPAATGEIAAELAAEIAVEPWLTDDLLLPVVASPQVIEVRTVRLAEALRGSHLEPPQIRSDVVLTERFNRLTEAADSKGVMLSQLSLRLLRSLWAPDTQERTLVIADKHGGRNRYDQLLAEVLDGQLVFRVCEHRERSTYRVGCSELRFEARAESHFPVAVASIISKYVRELAMLAFNRFWSAHLPALRPTAGYPEDARRFKRDIGPKQAELGIEDGVLWRCR
jgi:hypothetical protein